MIFFNRVKELTSTTGTGSITLAGPATGGFFPFSGVGNGNSFRYVIDAGQGDVEVGQGTYNSGSNTFTRDSVETSSNGNALVNFGAGIKTVFIDVPASFFNAIPNANLANSSLTVAAGSGLSGGGAVSLGGSTTLSIGAGAVTNSMLAGSIAASKLVGIDITVVGTLVAGSIPYSLLTGTPSPPAGANPTATAGVSAVNGSATTFLRSDGAPAINQAAAFAFSALGNTNITSGNVLSWNSDSGWSRSAAATLNAGNGTQGDATAQINAGKVVLAGTLTLNPTNGAMTLGQSNSVAIASSNSLRLVCGPGDVIRVENGGLAGAGNDTPAIGFIAASIGSPDCFISRFGAAVNQLGNKDAIAPVAQTLRAQSVASTATANTAAPDLTYVAPLGLGNAPTGGRHIWQNGAIGGSGTTQQTPTTGMILDRGNLTLVGKAINYNNIATAGLGLTVVYGAANITAQSAAATITTYTTPAADGDYEVSASMNVTAATGISTSLAVTYTDVNNVAQTIILPSQLAGGTGGTYLTNGLIITTGDYSTPVHKIRCKASTTITIKTSTGTFTGVVYSASGNIKQAA